MAMPGKSGVQGLTVDNKTKIPVDPERPVMLHGFAAASKNVASVHPLQEHLATYNEKMDAMNFSMLQKTQGIAGPLKLMVERDAASKVNRLPFLPSSNLMMDVLTGRDEDVSIEDIMGGTMEPELMGSPHMIMERKLGLL